MMTLDDNITKSNHPKLVACRLFVGNLLSDRCTKQELVDLFQPCGNVLGVSIHKGYAFVQMDNEVAVDKAVKTYHKAMFKGQALDVKPKIANESGPPMRKRPMDDDLGPYPYGPDRPPWDGQHGDYYSDYPPDFGPEFMHRRGPPPGMGPRFSGMPPHMEDPYAGGPPPGHFGPPSGPSPYPPGHPNGGQPIYGQEPYRDDKYSAPGPPQQQQPLEESQGSKRAEYGVERPFDSVIVVTSKNLKHYAEMVERRLLELNMVVDMIFLLNEKALNKAIDDMACRGVLYIIVIQQQHEEHKSITANIMHGTPQEHRNMPLEDALVMLARDFNGYLSSLRCGSEQPTMGFLLNLLADGKHLSVAELDRIITHLQDRRDRLIEAEGGRKEPSSNSNTTVALQQKILSIVSSALLNTGITSTNSTTNSTVGGQQSATGLPSSMPPAATLANMAQQFGISLNAGGQQQPTSADSTGSRPFNLSDPNLTKTIDNLLQNPNIFKNLNQPTTVAGNQQAPPPVPLMHHPPVNPAMVAPGHPPTRPTLMPAQPYGRQI